MKNSKNTEFYRDVDVVVVGGGCAGVAAAVHAARNGAKTLLLERYGRLGGCATSSQVCTLFGSIRSDFVKEFDARYRKIGRNWDLLDLLLADMVEEAGAELLLHAWAFEALKEGDQVTGVRLVTKAGVLDVRAKVVIDASADADIAANAGADFEIGRESDGLMQPMTIMFRVGGVDKKRGFLCGSEKVAHRIETREGSWHDVVERACEEGRLPKNVGVVRIYEAPNPGERLINATQVNYVNGLDITQLTSAELECRRQAVAVTELLREKAQGYENCFISQMPAVIGVRETRRVLGLEYLTLDDLMEGRKWETAVVQNANFPVDIHNPDGPGQSLEKNTTKDADRGGVMCPKAYDIPYGCFVPRHLDGLMVTGRCISGSHEAHGSYRNQRITMAMGVAVGTSAALAVRDGVQPRDVNVTEVQQIIGIAKGAQDADNTPRMPGERDPNLPVKYAAEVT